MISNTTIEETLPLVPAEDEWPVSTFIAVCFIASYILLLIVVKTIIEWSEFIKANNNQFDLIIYKPPLDQKPQANNNANGNGVNGGMSKFNQSNNSSNNNRKNNHEKRLFDNSAVRQHNLNAFHSTGIPLETLIDSNSFFRRV